MRAAARLAWSSLVLALPSAANAVPSPDTVAVVFNAAVPGSVALAMRYAEARAIPSRQRCGLDLPTSDTITLAEYRDRVATPLRRCLTDGGVDARIEALVLVRGVPLRVAIPATGGAQNASLAAVLMVDGARYADGAAFLDRALPGVTRSCGTTACLAARWVNPYDDGEFSAGWTRTLDGVQWNLRLVTMLHGRSDEEAGMLVQSALDGDAAGTVPGAWMLMNGADPARAALDHTYDAVAERLRDLGRDVRRVPFDTALTGQTLAAFVTGTASLGTTIEGNRLSPGAVVDNLTSFGAVPQNFTTTGEAQVSVARWIARGAAGAHGTVDEPLNNCFPRRDFLTDYAEGSTLAEAYLRNMPFVYWRNVVLGDPMAAPWARRPRVTVDGVREGETLTAPRRITLHGAAPDGATVATTALYLDGVARAHVDGDTISWCLEGDGARELLAVSQLAQDSGPGLHTPKGWTRLRVTLRNAVGGCDADAGNDAATAVDASDDRGDAPAVFDAGDDAPRPSDAGAPRTEVNGCACTTTRPSRSRGAFWAALALLALGVRRGRRAATTATGS